MDPRFLEAWVNRADHRVFGRKLHPLCFLDLLALEAVESPFGPSSDATHASRRDYHLAVEILSRPIRSLEINDRIAEPNPFTAWLFSKYEVAEANTALQAYFNDYFVTLEMWRSENGGKVCNAPWILTQVTFLLNHTNLTEWRIWTAPVGQMLCYAAALEEQLSSSQVISEEERAMMEEARRAEG